MYQALRRRDKLLIRPDFDYVWEPKRAMMVASTSLTEQRYRDFGVNMRRDAISPRLELTILLLYNGRGCCGTPRLQ